MRIQSNGPQSAATKQTEKSKPTGRSDAPSSEAKGKWVADSAKTEISSRAKDMGKAKRVAEDAPDVREAKVAELKRKIADKEYQVSAEAIADRMVDDHIATARVGV